MLREKLKKNRNYWKILAIYLLLLAANVYLFVGLFNYYSGLGFRISPEHIENLSAIVATVSILGYISGKLPKIHNLGQSAVFGMAYILIACVITLVSSYFFGKINAAEMFGSYLEMFQILCAVLIFILLATHLKSFKGLLNGEFTQKNMIVCLILFVLCGMFASFARVTINGTPANIRCFIVMTGGLVGGPFVGIPVGLIAGAYRFSLGGVTALPCALSTVLSGIIGSLFFIWNDKKYPDALSSLILTFLLIGFEMFLVVILTPPDISFPFVGDIYSIMLFGAIMGTIIFILAFKGARHNPDDDVDVNEEIDELKSEIKALKSEIEEMKNE